MCGIVGIIGESKDPLASFEMLTCLFRHTEIRGNDASGFWATESGENEAIIYHKEPIKSNEFVQKKIWKRTSSSNIDLLLAHCRAATRGVGSPTINKNNHPFTSSDKTIGLIHNGKFPEIEYKSLSNNYETNSNCDSEMLLRIFESGNNRDEDKLKGQYPDLPYEISLKVEGIREIWSYMNYGAMAVAIGEWMEGNRRRLWLFRNKQRPIWLCDLRKELGQVFFFSTPRIWHDAISNCVLSKSHLYNKPIFDLPQDEIWMLEITNEERSVISSNIKKFTVKKDNTFLPWKLNGENFDIEKKECPVKLITKLDENEEPITKHKPKVEYRRPEYSVRDNEYRDDPIDTYEPFDDGLFREIGDTNVAIGHINEKCRLIKRLVEDLATTAENKLIEGSVDDNEFADLLDSLYQIELDIEGTIRIIG